MCGQCGCDEGSLLVKRSNSSASPVQGWVDIGASLLDRNRTLAEKNRQRLALANIIGVNLMSSPGAGKTTLLVETLKALLPTYSAAVIEADQQTDLDAERIRATGSPAVQINTGTRCHLDANDVSQVLGELVTNSLDWLFIENIGNLICPSHFDLGETLRVVLFAVTEGEDKPLKYPDMFSVADAVVLTKMDLAAAVEFDHERCYQNLRVACPQATILATSARRLPGIASWLDWLAAQRHMRFSSMPSVVMV